MQVTGDKKDKPGRQRQGQHNRKTLTLALKQGNMQFREAIGYMLTCSKATRLSAIVFIFKV